MYCQHCGHQVPETAANCPNCGRVVRQPLPGPQVQTVVVREKDPAMAAVLSALIVGLGQIYNGQIGKGLLMMGLAVVSGLLTTVVIGCLFLPVVWVWAIYDAYNTAKAINAQTVPVWPSQPQLVSLAQSGANLEQLPALQRTLKQERNSHRRTLMIQALGKSGEPTVAPALVEALGDRQLEVRRAAAGALVELGEPAIETVMSALQHRTPMIRAGAAKVLGELKEPRAVDGLLPLLREKQPNVRALAAEALGKIGDPRALALLEELAAHDENPSVPGPTVANVAREAIQRIEGEEGEAEIS